MSGLPMREMATESRLFMPPENVRASSSMTCSKLTSRRHSAIAKLRRDTKSVELFSRRAFSMSLFKVSFHISASLLTSCRLSAMSKLMCNRNIVDPFSSSLFEISFPTYTFCLTSRRHSACEVEVRSEVVTSLVYVFFHIYMSQLKCNREFICLLCMCFFYMSFLGLLYSFI